MERTYDNGLPKGAIDAAASFFTGFCRTESTLLGLRPSADQCGRFSRELSERLRALPLTAPGELRFGLPGHAVVLGGLAERVGFRMRDPLPEVTVVLRSDGTWDAGGARLWPGGPARLLVPAARVRRWWELRGWARRGVKRAVALAIERRGTYLFVLRPPDDERFPDVWGLPAASVAERETPEDAARRAGEDKLGVRVRVRDPFPPVVIDRGPFVLHMTVYRAAIEAGAPAVPGKGAGTQYVDVGYKPVEHGIASARLRSACCMALLSGLGVPW